MSVIIMLNKGIDAEMWLHMPGVSYAVRYRRLPQASTLGCSVGYFFFLSTFDCILYFLFIFIVPLSFFPSPFFLFLFFLLPSFSFFLFLFISPFTEFFLFVCSSFLILLTRCLTLIPLLIYVHLYFISYFLSYFFLPALLFFFSIF